jgi:hypothetical protein
MEERTDVDDDDDDGDDGDNDNDDDDIDDNDERIATYGLQSSPMNRGAHC